MAGPATASEQGGGPAGGRQGYGDEARLTRRAVRWLVLLALAGLLVSGWGALVSVAAGGGLALVNFIWLRWAVAGALAEEKRSVTAAAAGFAGRFGLILAGLFAIVQLSFLSLLWAVGGLSVFVLAGIEEAIRLLWRR